MANTITTAVIHNAYNARQIYFTLKSDGTQESNTIIYDPTSSTFTNTKGAITGAYVATRIRRVFSSCSCITSTPQIYLTWDANTPVAAFSIPSNNEMHFNQQGLDLEFPPLPNQGSTGVSGKIGITTLGLAAGDTITIILEVLNG